MIATLATRADEAGIATCVVSTDRDAFQLVLGERLPDDDAARRRRRPRLHARAGRGPLGVPPEQVPDFIGLKGDTSDNIPGVPGIGDKTAAQLIAQYGSLEGVLEHVDELSPGAREDRSREHADQARDVEGAGDDAPRPRHRLRPDGARARAAGPLGAEGDVPPLRVPRRCLQRRRPAGRGAARGRTAAWPGRSCAGAKASRPRPRAGRLRGGRRPQRRRDSTTRSSCRPRPQRGRRRDRRPRRQAASRVDAVDDTLLAAYLIEPGRTAYELTDLAAEYGDRARSLALRRGGDGGARPPCGAAAAAGSLHARPPGRARPRPAVRERRAAAQRRARARWRTPASASTPTAWARSPRGSASGSKSSKARAYELAGEEFMLGSTQQVARVLFEQLELTPGRKGKTGYSTDTRVLADDPRRARDRAGDRGVARADEARQHVPRAAARAASARTAGCTRRSTRPSPPRAGCPRRIRTSSRSRSAPSSAARSAPPSSRRRAASCSRPTTRRSSCASSRTSRASRSCGRRSQPARTSTARPPPRCSAASRSTLTKDERAIAKMINFGIVYGISAYGLSREPRDPARAGADVHRHLSRALPARAGLHRAHDRAGRRATATSRPCSAGGGPCPRSATSNRADPRARGAAGRELRHAGLERRHHQGGDDRASTAPS